MAVVCIKTLPSFSSTKVRSRVSQTRSAIMSMAVSSSSSSHLVEYGLRYLMRVSRLAWVSSSKLSEPLGQSRPRDIKDAGSPSIEINFPFLWYTSWPHPTAQYGQTERATSADSCRGRRLRVLALIASTPVPSPPERIWRITGQRERSSSIMRAPNQSPPFSGEYALVEHRMQYRRLWICIQKPSGAAESRLRRNEF